MSKRLMFKYANQLLKKKLQKLTTITSPHCILQTLYTNPSSRNSNSFQFKRAIEFSAVKVVIVKCPFVPSHFNILKRLLLKNKIPKLTNMVRQLLVYSILLSLLVILHFPTTFSDIDFNRENFSSNLMTKF